jgi:AcrR family transcriptional regulator
MLEDPPLAPTRSKRRSPPRQQGWTQDPERVRRDILDVAREEFAARGFSGARVDAIAARTACSKRMIYYYFGDKQHLYVAVLEEAYQLIRARETGSDLDALAPREAMAALAALTFDHHANNPWFVRLVMVENIHNARHLKMSTKIAALNATAIEALRRVYERGVASGDFRPGLDPLQLHLTISALSFYNVSNRASIQEVFGHDMAEPAAHGARRQIVVDTLLRYVAA